MKKVKRFEVWLARLDPTVGAETKKTRLVVIVSPDELNALLQTVIVAPMTHARINWPIRIDATFNKDRGQVKLDQIRAVDKARLVKKQGSIQVKTKMLILRTLQEMFAE